MADPKNGRSPKASFDHVIAMLKHILFRLIPHFSPSRISHLRATPGFVAQCYLIDR